ncbi:hypothetical protein HWA87_gp76 [Salmonella phage 35]|uniref:Uncharacterized protein n=1 Tax=Salmonella phage 35 TaxID=1654888 RepID=A0A0N6WGD6_9CAUD|nr:hypothetical protein HWA87_gp76 [Salmonella phage 35]AKJ74139.1 hypothetical protein SP35_76 [Salmonella phage 35]
MLFECIAKRSFRESRYGLFVNVRQVQDQAVQRLDLLVTFVGRVVQRARCKIMAFS